MTSENSRQFIAKRQAELLRSLFGEAQTREGIRQDHLRAATESLQAKRIRAAARAWPILSRELAANFSREFSRFASTTPLPHNGGPFADGRNFVDWLARRTQLCDAIRIQVLRVDVKFARHGLDLMPRTMPAVAIARCEVPRRIVVAARIPNVGQWMLSIPLQFRMRHGRGKE